jgi:hypothetical protein
MRDKELLAVDIWVSVWTFDRVGSFTFGRFAGGSREPNDDLRRFSDVFRAFGGREGALGDCVSGIG